MITEEQKKELRNMIRMAFPPRVEKPAVFLSGGIDSTIVLHHLRDGFDGPINTYTAIFGTREHEGEKAKVVASEYGTIHTEVPIEGFLDVLIKTQFIYSRARFNVWPYYLFEQATQDGCKTILLGEGGDENFGGYSDRSYLEGWAGQIEWVRPVFDELASHFKVQLHAPLSDINPDKARELFHEPSYKRYLREAYSGILPNPVIYQSGQPPNMTQYEKFWAKEIHGIPTSGPDKVAGIKEQLQLIAEAARTQLLAGVEIKNIVKEVLGK